MPLVRLDCLREAKVDFSDAEEPASCRPISSEDVTRYLACKLQAGFVKFLYLSMCILLIVMHVTIISRMLPCMFSIFRVTESRRVMFCRIAFPKVFCSG